MKVLHKQLSRIKMRTLSKCCVLQASCVYLLVLGSLASRSRTLDMENFNTEVNIPPGAKVQFELHYQEVKWRKLGSYEHKIHLQPGKLAKHLEVSLDSQGRQQCTSLLYLLSPPPWRCLMPLAWKSNVVYLKNSAFESTTPFLHRFQCKLSSLCAKAVHCLL
jgi:hypothetical protein